MTIMGIVSIAGIALMILGYGSAVYGIHQMYAFYQLPEVEQELVRAERMLVELFGGKLPVSDTVWIAAGAVVFALGLAALIISYRKRCAEEKE